MAAWRCVVTRCGAFLSSSGAMAAATAVASSGNDTEEELRTEEEHTPVGDASLPPPPKRPLQFEKKRFDPANPASPTFRHIGAIKDAPEKKSLGLSNFPLVPIGMGATVLALLYMYRMIAQFLTIMSLLLGTIFWASKEPKVQTEPEAEGRKEI
uniref:HIG1 domain-containing protein n=1 Tax=Globodera pallida TaxID=36090 RepID=A0A183BX69_GLOPA